MTRMFCLCLVLFSWVSAARSEEYRAIFWNLQSGHSNDATIAAQMVAKGEIDFWGLSEVRNQAALDTFEQALEAAHPGIDFAAKLSEQGGSDRLAILYRTDRLTAVEYSGSAAIDEIGDHFFEVDSINVGGTIRPGLGIQLQAANGQMIVALVNHWKCCGGNSNQQRRHKQAIQMNAFAIQTPGIPIVAAGDFNIPLDRGGQNRAAFQELSQVWDYKAPQPNVGTFRSGSVLDAVFVTNRVSGWESRISILKRNGDEPATSKTFSDNSSQTDHRPLLMVIKSDTHERMDGLREAIADMEAALARMKAELALLESVNNN